MAENGPESYEERAKRLNRERVARHRARKAQEAPLRHPLEAEKRWEHPNRPVHALGCRCGVCQAERAR